MQIHVCSTVEMHCSAGGGGRGGGGGVFFCFVTFKSEKKGV